MFAFLSRHWLLSALLSIIGLLLIVLASRTIGPYRFYRADLLKPAPGDTVTPGVLEVGVATRNITPELTFYDTWNDADGNSEYEPDKGDTFTDSNGNGQFDAVWIAGFGNNRAAKGVHDDLWVRAIAFRNNGVTTVLVSIDAIGILHEQFIEVRKSLDRSLNIDHVMFSSTHVHEGPDTLGIWSYSILPTKPYFDFDYLDLVKLNAKEAVEEAVQKLESAEAILSQVSVGPDGFVDDSRQPIRYDNLVRCARFVKQGSDTTIATMIVWGNHPETLGGDNSFLSSDFPHYIREGIEKGVGEPGGAEGFGGTCVFFQGMCGGLMTQLHTTVPHRNGVDTYREASFEKAQALGENVAVAAINALRGPSAWRPTDATVAVAAKSVFVPIEGMFAIANFLGLLHPGWYWGKGKTEVDAIRIGDMEILAIPGELYPEIGYGGIETPEGADFPVEPVEVPPLLDNMTGKLTMIIGLANDEIGYIIPKSQWDVEPPYAYGRTNDPQYGEENSLGPDVAGILHTESLELLERLHEVLPAN